MFNRPILFLSPLPPPYGGIATWTQKIFQHGFPNGNSLSLVNTKIRGKRHIFDHFGFSFSEFFRTFSIFISLFYQLISKRPKLAHLSSSLSAVGVLRESLCVVLLKLFRVPVVIHYRGNVPNFQRERLFGLSGICLQFLMCQANANIVENQFSFAAMQKIKKINLSKLFLLPNFIEDQFFENEINKITISNQSKTRSRALFVGGITTAKGCRELFETACQLPQIDFYLLGQLHDDMQEIYKKLPANIFLLGTASHEVVLQKMRESDFLVFPSYSEGFPLSVVEAMSVGLPVIATKVGAIPEMIDEGLGGFLVEPKNTNELVKAINHFLSDPTLRITMGNYNREKSFNQYRYSIVMKQLQEIYRQL